MTLKEALEKSDYRPRGAIIPVNCAVKEYYYEDNDVPIKYAILETWEPYMKWQPVIQPEITPQVGDVWMDGGGGQCSVHWNTSGCRLMQIQRDVSVRHDIPQGMIHGQNGWKLLFRDGKQWEGK